MDYIVLHGEFIIRYPGAKLNQSPQPDGDTIKFHPDNVDLVRDLARRNHARPGLNGHMYINVRLEAIDALETHFEKTHQEKRGGEAARNQLLAELGFKNLEFSTNPDYSNVVVSANADRLRGYVLSNGVDTYGRLIGFVLSSSHRVGDDGDKIASDDADLIKHVKNSANFKLLKEGLVYPAFYDSLPDGLRSQLKTTAQHARTQNSPNGIWKNAQATPSHPAHVTNAKSLEKLVMWPKLFRRLVTYFEAQGPQSRLSGFKSWMQAGGEKTNDSIRLEDGTTKHFHDIVKVAGDAINLTVEPETIVIKDKKPVSGVVSHHDE